jgi:ADP-ribose pyrophosphatase YjhB (NUDIX family)
MSNISSEPPKITLCVGGVVFRQDRVLFVRQAYGNLLGKWSLPWGFVDRISSDGYLEPPQMAVLREIRE